MSALQADETCARDDGVETLEGHIRELVRGDVVTTSKNRHDLAAEVTSETIGPLVQKMGAASIGEIEKLIAELEVARDYLKSEADRIQREMARYEYLSNTASASVKIIAHSLGQWRNSSSDAALNVVGEAEPA